MSEKQDNYREFLKKFCGENKGKFKGKGVLLKKAREEWQKIKPKEE